MINRKKLNDEFEVGNKWIYEKGQVCMPLIGPFGDIPKRQGYQLITGIHEAEKEIRRLQQAISDMDSILEGGNP